MSQSATRPDRALVGRGPHGEYLIGATGSPVAPAYFLIFAAIVSAVTLLLLKDRTNAPLD